MTTLYDSTRRVKPATRNHVFGQGIATSDRRAPFTAADLDFWAANAPSNAAGYEVVGMTDDAMEQAAGCALVQAKLDAGFPLF